MELQHKDSTQSKGTCTCSWCKGSGKRGRRTCPDCNGLGTLYLVDCPDCLGTGVSRDRGVCKTCKGKKAVSSVEADRIHTAREKYDGYLQNPAGVFFKSIACYIAIAFTARSVWDQMCVTLEFLFDAEMIFPSGFILLLALSLLFKQWNNLIKGSTNDADGSKPRTIGTVLFIVGILTAIIAGPVTSDGFGWMESKAKNTLNDKILKSSSVQCLEVELSRKVDYTYFGKAKMSNGESKDIVARFVKTGLFCLIKKSNFERSKMFFHVS